jgi:hypothetical protein
VTFSTVNKNKSLSGYYSFVEDFRRNKVSTTHTRHAEFGNAWVLPTDSKEWAAVNEARFTADANPVTNIDAGLAKPERMFFLKTGGDIENSTTKLREKIELPAANTKPKAPDDLPLK